MASRISSNLYAITSLDPIMDDESGSVVVYACLPVDLTPDGGISDQTRYVAFVSVPSGVNVYDLLTYFDYARAFSATWVTYMWEVE